MRVLITGNRGFVGRHFELYYRAAQHDVAGVDIADGEDCRVLFDEMGSMNFDLVIHCAAVVGGRAGIDGAPLHLMAEDLSIDAALFRWALRARPKRIVYFSSAAAYDVSKQASPRPEKDWAGRVTPAYEPSSLNEVEHMSGEPDATYGFVKRVGERLAREANAAGIRTHVFRPFSGYGSDQSLDYPFPRFIERAANHDDPFEIWGEPHSARDWVHIDDIVGAVLAAIDKDVLGPVNICTGRAVSFLRLATMCMHRAGYQGQVKPNADAPKGVYSRVGDPSRLLQFYRPRITLEEGIARALEARNAA